MLFRSQNNVNAPGPERKQFEQDETSKSSEKIIHSTRANLAEQLEKNNEKKWENFKDIKNYFENYTPKNIEIGGNPPYSILLSFIPNSEDSEDLTAFLISQKAISEADAPLLRSNGKILLPQLSEYTAIYLANALRRFDLEILLGQSNLIYESSIGELNNAGVNSPNSLKNYKPLKGTFINGENVLVSHSDNIPDNHIQSFKGHVRVSHVMLWKSEG